MKRRLAVLIAAVIMFLVGFELGLPALKNRGPIPYPPIRVARILESESVVRDKLRGLPSNVDIMGSSIVVIDRYSDSLVAVFDLDGTPVARYLTEGEGPTEVKTLANLETRGDTAFVYDAGRGRVVKFVPGRAAAETAIESDIIGLNVNDVNPYPGGYILSEITNGLFTRWHGEMDVDTVGKLTPVLRKVRRDARHGNRALRVIAVHPMEELVAVAFMGTGELVVANTDGEVNAVTRPMAFDFDKRYVAMPEALTYVAVAATDSAIYALFIGKRTEEAFVSRAPDARHIHKYDWSGNLQAIWEIDHPAVDLAVDGNNLYTAHAEPVPEIRRYVLTDPRSCPSDTLKQDTGDT